MMHRADINIFQPVVNHFHVRWRNGSDFEFCYFSDNGSSLCISGLKFDSSISVILANVLVDQNSNSATSVILETLNGPQSEPFGDSRSKWCPNGRVCKFCYL
ncbi:hypothetical protein CEXT_620251 [Caerostris extrusa]|uniref:Uncharacterized protein n=1 Tax=Caerostris extrusa TaxID=172846 RepID=A0AAV4WVB3_CAEEX|nr:hypothetical protein CEXT_620251 [Caerostris extrusa]